ncbi:hypothetical protein [Nonomuraea jiangxiensis]|uniref:YD repeat-containing protein n=1 Tax=Nonomuraea jiangxiensis TaxID=633440 RepID=A0A1G8Y0K7_9ACTN|nr:hypothetical protein [Nonomuraea jiangxiensis]SDJ96338.1 hypothetical protein SAMN05421869_113134 [Nonomuraea jiangxiensis]
MRTIGKLLVGTVLAGAVATGIAAAPAASASAATATTAIAATTATAAYSNGWKRFDRGDGRFEYRWGKSNGRYWLDFRMWDRDRHDRDYSFFDVYYKRDGRWYHYKRFSSKSFYSNKIVFGRDVDDFRIRGGYGHDNRFGWGGYHYR